ncbi:hypothetical protein Ahy_B03g064736 isoform A [Arachis hypogaea]|uniref:Uncharacterized protein n=1 Tax=Arachis hypogaea TaxID=3818 RepID=A0A445A0B4_ARAHY|nr:hypothetical protein Ahy_B03g064736 isoform A [Arachis hypogaea]
MMLGESHRSNPTVHVPPWPPLLDDPTAEMYSPFSGTGLSRYLPSNDVVDDDSDSEAARDIDAPVDAYSCDHFRMFEFKLRVLPQHSPRSVDSYDGSPLRHAMESSCAKTLPFLSSPGSDSPPAEDSPPMNLQLSKVKSLPSSWNVPMGSPGYGSPRGPMIRSGFCSLPSTPTEGPGGSGVNCFEVWDQSCCFEEPVMERVESGRGIRARMFEKLSKENSLDGSASGSGGAPDVGWVSELIK